MRETPAFLELRNSGAAHIGETGWLLISSIQVKLMADFPRAISASQRDQLKRPANRINAIHMSN